jgi:DNA-binding PadR family transcriptional regulator
MKTLFLVWYRHRQEVDGPFHFEPYLYGPCAFDLYSTLDTLLNEGLISQDGSSYTPKWAAYRLTKEGSRQAEKLSRALPSQLREELARTAKWAASRAFSQLLRDVYGEAPEFAANTVFR